MTCPEDMAVLSRQSARLSFPSLVPHMRQVDPHLPGHSWRVAALSVPVGRAMGLCSPELDDLAAGGLLHDIGKLALPSSIVQAPRRLTAKEQTLVRVHSTVGARCLEAWGCREAVVAISRHHHERMDGRGYPDGLGGAAMRLSIRICAVADVWDALVSVRSYKRALPVDRAERVLAEMAGAHLDATVVEAFFDLKMARASVERRQSA